MLIKEIYNIGDILEEVAIDSLEIIVKYKQSKRTSFTLTNDTILTIPKHIDIDLMCLDALTYVIKKDIVNGR